MFWGNLTDAAKTAQERNALYGDTYKDVGPLLAKLFAGGGALKTEADWNRFFTVLQCANKLLRYASCISSGGHRDSAHDLMVYAAMLEAMTDEKNTVLVESSDAGRTGQAPGSDEGG